jgi:hypothetical protein
MTQAKRAQLTEHPRSGGSLELASTGPAGFCFTMARHGLTAAQCVQANQLLRRLERTRPIREHGARWQAKMALRIAGIVSAVKGNRVGNRRWGKHMIGKRAGKVMALHGLAHLRQWAPIAHLASLMARERREAAAHWEQTGTVLPIGARPAPSPEAQRIQDLITAWEASQWQQTDRFSW